VGGLPVRAARGEGAAGTRGEVRRAEHSKRAWSEKAYPIRDCSALHSAGAGTRTRRRRKASHSVLGPGSALDG
jgi:hypothetical protein